MAAFSRNQQAPAGESEFDQTHWIAQRRRGPLPTFYYHEHFIEMLGFVKRNYAHALQQPHRDVLRRFSELPESAQRLYVRLVNRKGCLFAADKLHYPELGELEPILAELRSTGWIQAPDADNYEDLLHHLTRAEIEAVLRPKFAGLSRALKKPQLVGFARQHCVAADFVRDVDTTRLLVRCYVDEVRYLLFLYFGRVQHGLSRFTMRDLGLVRAQGDHEDYDVRFAELDEALENYFYALRRQQLTGADDGQVDVLANEVKDWPGPAFSSSAALRDKLAFELGSALEKRGACERALDVYACGESARCAEREIRLLLLNGRRDAAETRLLYCIENPRSDEEALMARDLYARKFNKKKTSTATDELRAAETIDLDEAHVGAPEKAAIEHYRQQDIPAFRTENRLWRSFFGLLFWDLLFAAEGTASHSPFEFMPAELQNGSFVGNNRRLVESRLALLAEPRKLKQMLLKASSRNYGRENGLFRWRRSLLDPIFALIEHAPAEAMRVMLLGLGDDYMNARYGYPDLMLIDEAGVRFVEIKAEGDQLRKNQLLRQQQLRAAGFRSDIVRVRWTLDARQVYVVVDVETTGGKGPKHRVTEIGAVKMQGGKIVDKFQTMLNPQRTIPAGITRLTGISPAMVANAPLFADIADEFADFMGDAIFVAHNVEFDYGFIAQEFARIGRKFRHAKLCTCASMRKLYPGHSSYSLASLCRSFGITLANHHRALCDAEAAAELLRLVNEKRAERLREPGDLVN